MKLITFFLLHFVRKLLAALASALLQPSYIVGLRFPKSVSSQARTAVM